MPRFFPDFLFGPGFPETFEGPEFEQRGNWLRIHYHPEGCIHTNEHVIRYADKITVTLKDGESFEAKVLGSNPEIDLAVIKINAKKPLPYAELGDRFPPDRGMGGGNRATLRFSGRPSPSGLSAL